MFSASFSRDRVSHWAGGSEFWTESPPANSLLPPVLVSQEYVALPGFFTGMLGTQTQVFICTALLLFSRFSCCLLLSFFWLCFYFRNMSFISNHQPSTPIPSPSSLYFRPSFLYYSSSVCRQHFRHAFRDGVGWPSHISPPVLRIETRATHTLGTCPTTQLHPQTSLFFPARDMILIFFCAYFSCKNPHTFWRNCCPGFLSLTSQSTSSNALIQW